ncbi:MAG: hypothetical protein WC553_01015 [Patescibacteria group bacterium]|jgi:hypothetical protein
MDNQIVNAVIDTATDQAKQAANTAAQGIFERIFNAYNAFVGMFPDGFQWVVSLVLILAIASFLFNLIKKNWLWIILLVVIFPGVLPILKNIFDSLTAMFIGKPMS